jgi:thiol-disulfide isomerase/thioredoxin
MSTSLVVVLAVVGLLVALQVALRLKARGMRGRPLPELPGPLGARLAAAPRALVYLFSPSCAACKPLTPRFNELGRNNPGVFVVNVVEELALARALGVMGTPTVIEVVGGRVAGYHVGGVPAEVLARFAAAPAAEAAR